jgi:hypothetical protein
MSHLLRQEYQRIRHHSLQFIEGISAEDAQA